MKAVFQKKKAVIALITAVVLITAVLLCLFLAGGAGLKLQGASAAGQGNFDAVLQPAFGADAVESVAAGQSSAAGNGAVSMESGAAGRSEGSGNGAVSSEDSGTTGEGCAALPPAIPEWVCFKEKNLAWEDGLEVRGGDRGGLLSEDGWEAEGRDDSGDGKNMQDDGGEVQEGQGNGKLRDGEKQTAAPAAFDQLVLSEKSFKVYQNGNVCWEPDGEVLVQDFLWCDIDRDGAGELLLLCWKIGKYGEHRPFWVEEDELCYSQHIFIYDWTGERMDPLWMASDPGVAVADWCFDKHGYLLVKDTEDRISSWAWLSWGLEGVDTSVSFAAVGDDLVHMQIVGCGSRKKKEMEKKGAALGQAGLEAGPVSGQMEQQEKAEAGTISGQAGWQASSAASAYDFMFEHVKDRVQEADIAIINQETMLIDDPVMYSGFPRFGSPPEIADAIANAGFDVAACATNHSLDKGMRGIKTTASKMSGNHILCLGIQEDSEDYRPYEIISRKRIRFALLNYTYGTNGLPVPPDFPYAVHLFEEKQVRSDIRAAKEDADVVVVLAHWGTEYRKEPDAFQEKWRDIFLEEGVDVVIGTHPHVVQPYEMLTRGDGHEMLIYYSLGNFISAQETVDTVLCGMAQFTVALTFDGCRITDYGLAPLVTHQQSGNYTTYFLEDYTQELAAAHRLAKSGLTLEVLEGMTAEW